MVSSFLIVSAFPPLCPLSLPVSSLPIVSRTRKNRFRRSKEFSVAYLTWITTVMVQTFSSGAYSGVGAVRCAPPPLSDSGGGGVAPPGFSESKESTVTPHSNSKRDQEEEGYRKRRNILFLELWWPKNSPSSLLAISVYPLYSLFFIRNRKQNSIFLTLLVVYSSLRVFGLNFFSL